MFCFLLLKNASGASLYAPGLSSKLYEMDIKTLIIYNKVLTRHLQLRKVG